MSQLGDALDRVQAIKREHIRDEQRLPGPRDSTITDVETLRLLVPPGTDADELWALGLAHAEAILRDLRKAGQLRGANRATLRGVLFTAWIDGALLALHVRR